MSKKQHIIVPSFVFDQKAPPRSTALYVVKSGAVFCSQHRAKLPAICGDKPDFGQYFSMVKIAVDCSTRMLTCSAKISVKQDNVMKLRKSSNLRSDDQFDTNGARLFMGSAVGAVLL